MKHCQKLLAASLAAAMVLLAGCSRSSTSSSAQSSSAASGTSANSQVANLNETGFPIVNQAVTMSIFGSQDQNQTDWENMWFFKTYSAMTGINFDFQQVPAQGFDEKKNLTFASNELPDIFYRANITREQVAQYGVMSHQLLALDPYLEKYAPNFYKILKTNDVVRQSVTASDGHIYVLPQLDFSATGILDFKPFINQQWLTKLGLKAPTTPEELKNVLIAFRDKDPNGNGQKDEIPLGIREISSIYELGGSWGLEFQMSDTINVVDGKIHYWLKDDNFKSYLQYLSDLYKEKLLWQNYYKTDSRPEWRSNLANALFGSFYMPYSDVFINVESQFVGYAPIVGPKGDQTWGCVNSGVGAGGFALSSTCSNPEAALRWVDYFYSDEGSLFYRYGKEGETFHYDSTGVPRVNDDILNSSDGFMTALGRINLVPGGGGAHLITDQTCGIVASDLVKQISSDLRQYMPKKMYIKPPLTAEDQERVNAITQDLNKYRDESVTKFIIGEWSFDQWDTYCATLNQIGLAELESIYQKAFEAEK